MQLIMPINYSELRVNIFLTLGLTLTFTAPFFRLLSEGKKRVIFLQIWANIGTKTTRFRSDFPLVIIGHRERKRAKIGARKSVKKEF